MNRTFQSLTMRGLLRVVVRSANPRFDRGAINDFFVMMFASALLLPFAAAVENTDAEERRWDARTLFANAVTSDVRLTADGAAIELKRGELIEDDGPAAGYSYRPNEDTLSDDVWIKKQLVVTDPRTDGALLLVGSKGTLQFRVNGVPCELPHVGAAGSYWRAYSLQPETLNPGTNEFEIYGSGKLWIARDDEFAAGSRKRTRHPNRSAKSTDGGRTWDDRRLGTDGNVDGEYYVRLFLDRYRSQGSLILPVIDIGNLRRTSVAPALKSFGPIRVRLEAEDVAIGNIKARQRTGSTPIPAENDWTDWRELNESGVVEEPRGRFVQVEVLLTTDNPLASPRLKGVVIEADAVRSSEWVTQLKICEARNAEIVRTSIPFEYEPLDHPKLKTLRQRYDLDKVTAGASDEFELIKRLAAWSATRWTRLGHLGEAYPPWDALEILKPHADGTPVGGFCQQFNVVFLQACESYGLVGRAVSLGPSELTDTIRGGHEVVEIWSNDFQKWIYVDGNYAWYFIDAENDIPLSLWELRQRQLAAFRDEPHRPVRLVRIIDTGKSWSNLKDHPPFAELRLIPRSNFLEAASPLPLNQGMRGWFWTGHYVWTDEQTLTAPLYGHRISKLSNWQWTLNQSRYTLVAADEPGMLHVYLDTETPGFDTFLARIDQSEKRPVQTGFSWRLRAGRNRLDVCSRNISGREGPASSIVLEYQP